MHNVPYELLAIVKSMQERKALGIEDLLKPGTPATNDEQSLNVDVQTDVLPPLVHDQGANAAQSAQSSRSDGATDGAEKDDDNAEEKEEKDENEEDDDEEEECKVMVTEAASVDVSCLSIAQALSFYPKETVEKAIENEMENMIKKQVFGPVKKGDDIPGNLIIPSKFFIIKDKGTAGDPELKGIFVGGVHRQDESI